jgi:ribosomal protein S3
MPYTTKMADVHYWQNYARTKRAAIGIKIWLFFNTMLYSLNTKKQKNIKVKE